ncbi:MAG: hypothetical protein JXR10_14605 [Cyclobacteriaceae bacterium]
MTIEGKSRKAYSTAFDASAKTVERGWWKYSSQFGRAINMRGYYTIVIPAEMNGGTADLELFSRALSNKMGSRFYLALNTKDVPADKVSSYNTEVKRILQNFKRSYYINWIETKLEKEEKKAIRAGKKASKAKGKSREKALQELAALDESTAKMKADLLEVYQAYQ